MRGRSVDAKCKTFKSVLMTVSSTVQQLYLLSVPVDECPNTDRCLCLSSGRTEFQTASVKRARRSVRFERKASQRYSRRPTFERSERERMARAVASKAAAPSTARCVRCCWRCFILSFLFCSNLCYLSHRQGERGYN